MAIYNLTLEQLTEEFILDTQATLQIVVASQDCTISQDNSSFSWTNELAKMANNSFNANTLELEQLELEQLESYSPEILDIFFYQELGFDLTLELGAI